MIVICDVDTYSVASQYEIITLHELENEAVNRLANKYGKGSDAFRWGLKPVILKHLLTTLNFERVIYCDNDIYFFSNPTFLFDLLHENAILLTPHYYKYYPDKEQHWFEANFRIGLYNAGFVAVNKSAIPMLDWWEKACIYTMKKSYWRGLYDDQKYLDLVPVLFDKTHILKNKGCNIAGWNYDVDKCLTDEKDDIVFIHFTPLTIRIFANNNYDEYLKKYFQMLEQQGYETHLLFKRNWRRDISDYLYHLKWRLVRIFEK